MTGAGEDMPTVPELIAYIARLEAFWDVQETLGFPTCQRCRHFTAWGDYGNVEGSQQCDVLMQGAYPIDECPALAALERREVDA